MTPVNHDALLQHADFLRNLARSLVEEPGVEDPALGDFQSAAYAACVRRAAA